MFPTRRKIVSGLLALGALAALLVAHPADAQSYSGDTTGGPTFVRPNEGNPPTTVSATTTSYHAHTFTPTATAKYKIVAATTAPTWDNYIFIYQGASFNPADPLTNCLASNDDFGNLQTAGVDGIPLTAGQPYTIVVSGYGAASQGTFDVTITQLPASLSTTGKTTWTRPEAGTPPTPNEFGNGTAVPFDVVTYTPTETALYRVAVQSQTPNYDPFIVLFNTSPSAANPTFGAIAANDDLVGGDLVNSGLDVTLTAGTTYYLAVTGYANGDFGVYTYSFVKIFSASKDGTTTDAPTYNRPGPEGAAVGNPPTTLSGVGTAVPYSVMRVTVAESGNYTFLLTSLDGHDSFVALHAGSFDPSDGLANVLYSNDDLGFGDFEHSGFSNVPLLAGVEYLVVASGYANTDSGDFNLTITGPSPITISVNRTISGLVTLQECFGITFDATFILHPTDNSGDITRTVSVSMFGEFELKNVPAKNYQIKVKTANTLSRVMAADATLGDVADLAFPALKGGDAFDDNSVDVLDLDRLIQAFDSDPFAPNWNPNADFDCNDSVDVLDLDVLIRNFDQVGEDY